MTWTKPTMYANEDQLVAALRSGDERAFAWLLGEYDARLRRLTRDFVSCRGQRRAVERRVRDQRPVGSAGDRQGAAGEQFRSVGMDNIAEDEPFSLDELGAYEAGGRSWVAVAGEL